MIEDFLYDLTRSWWLFSLVIKMSVLIAQLHIVCLVQNISNFQDMNQGKAAKPHIWKAGKRQKFGIFAS